MLGKAPCKQDGREERTQVSRFCSTFLLDAFIFREIYRNDVVHSVTILDAHLFVVKGRNSRLGNEAKPTLEFIP